MTTAVGYARVSTEEQENSGLGLEAQRRALREESERHGWSMLVIHDDVASGKTRNRRRGLRAALDDVALGKADVLVAARIDRLSRSLNDLIELMDRSVQEGWALVTLDLRVDTSSPHGKAMARMAGVFAELERDLIAERTRAALAVKKAQGAKLGRPVTMPKDVRRRIKEMKAHGLGWTAIARKLNRNGVATAQGGKRWYPSTVRAMFLTAKPRVAGEGLRLFSTGALAGRGAVRRIARSGSRAPGCVPRFCHRTWPLPTPLGLFETRSRPVPSPLASSFFLPLVPLFALLKGLVRLLPTPIRV